jgi:hypothetical protein
MRGGGVQLRHVPQLEQEQGDVIVSRLPCPCELQAADGMDEDTDLGPALLAGCRVGRALCGVSGSSLADSCAAASPTASAPRASAHPATTQTRPRIDRGVSGWSSLTV